MDIEKQRRDPQIDDQEPSTEIWQAKVDCLEEIVCFLLLKNQTLRMALSSNEQANTSAGL